MQLGQQVGTPLVHHWSLVLGGRGGGRGGGELIGDWLASGCCMVVGLCGVESLLFNLIFFFFNWGVGECNVTVQFVEAKAMWLLVCCILGDLVNF